MAVRLDGRSLGKQFLRNKLAPRAQELLDCDVVPHLAVFTIGEDPSSMSYLKAIIRTFRETGVTIKVDRYDFPEGTAVDCVLRWIDQANDDMHVHGILPLHPMLGWSREEERRIFDAITPDKDVDGLSSSMVGKLALKEPGCIVPCTAEGIIRLLEASNITIEGKLCAVVGRGPTAGMPAILSLLNLRDGTLAICHTRTPSELRDDLTGLCDISIIAVRDSDTVTSSMFGSEATIIAGGKIDFDPSECDSRYFALRSDVGMMAIAILGDHTLSAAKNAVRPRRVHPR